MKRNTAKFVSMGLLAGSMLLTGGLLADGAELFRTKCGRCHTLHVGATVHGRGHRGPDLSGFQTSRPAEYLRLYMTNPDAARKQFADIYHANVEGRYGRNRMRAVQGLTPAQVQQIIDFIGTSTAQPGANPPRQQGGQEDEKESESESDSQ